MKKLLLVLFCAFTALAVSAQVKTYTDKLVITINDQSSEPQTADVKVVDNGNGTINFELRNFFMVAGENSIPVGHIILENLPVTDGENGVKSFTFNGTLVIQPGDMPGVDFWVGPEFGEIPLDLRGKMTDDKMYAAIDIDIREAFGQVLFVQFGTDDFTPGKIYTEQLVITINDQSSEPQTADVKVVDNGNGTINFIMKNFFMVAGENSVPVGNIVIENLPVTEGENGVKILTFKGNLVIQPGDMPGVDFWVGPEFGEIPLDLRGKMTDDKMYAAIDIDIREAFGQVLFVQFGRDNFFATEKIYTEQLVITVNGESSEPQMTGVTVIDNANQTIDFELKNFFLPNGETSIPVGNIKIENIPVTKGDDGLDYITFEGAVTIQPGDMEGVNNWAGPMVGEIPMKLQGKMNENKLFVTIDIDIQETLGQIVNVQVGTDDFINQEEIDAVNDVVSLHKSSSDVYDLSGRRVKNPSHGIYVVSGKKVLF
ncbi:MAG: calycin-like domain-containing protein [Bacteroidaceae bacterium]|nr:calycin-like domain-containing protein [Bacteroidaceae bacterium]